MLISIPAVNCKALTNMLSLFFSFIFTRWVWFTVTGSLVWEHDLAFCVHNEQISGHTLTVHTPKLDVVIHKCWGRTNSDHLPFWTVAVACFNISQKWSSDAKTFWCVMLQTSQMIFQTARCSEWWFTGSNLVFFPFSYHTASFVVKDGGVHPTILINWEHGKFQHWHNFIITFQEDSYYHTLLFH